MSAEKDKAKKPTGGEAGAGVNEPVQAPTLTDEQRRRFEALGMLPGTAPTTETPTSGMGLLDVLAVTENGPPGTGETMTLPSGTTIQNDPVPLGNGLVGVESTLTLPGKEPLTSSPSLGISPQEVAGLYYTDASYSPQQRDYDLALASGTLMGPHTADARAAAAARLNAHWNQSAVPTHPSGALLLPSADYSSTELAMDLQWASTTGPLDARSEQLRREAQDRLWRLGAYTAQNQDADQLTAQFSNYTTDNPHYRDELRRLILTGLSREDAEAVMQSRAAGARNRLEQAGIPVMFPDEAERLRQLEVSYPTDSRIPLMPAPDAPPDRKGPLTESEFRGWLGKMTGLTDLTEGLETGNLGQAAFGAAMTAFTFTPGAVLRPFGNGFRWLGGKLAGEAEQGLATELGVLGSGGGGFGRAGAEGGYGSPGLLGPRDPRPGTSLYVPDPAKPYSPGGRAGGGTHQDGDSVPEILDYPRGGGPWSARQGPPPSAPVTPGAGPTPQVSAAKLGFRTEGEKILGDMKVGGTDETVADAVFGARPLGDPARERATEIIGGGTAFGKAGKRAGMREHAVEWALAQGGRDNPGRFTNAFEYYKLQYDKFRTNPNRPSGVSMEELFVNNRVADEQLARDLEIVRLSGRGAVGLGANASDAEIAQALRSVEGLGFGDEMSAAYHTYKHWKEDPELEALGGPVFDPYQNSAARTVRDGRLVKVWQDDRTGYRKFTYQRVVDDGDGNSRITEVIVGVDVSGEASILTYGKPKSVRLGPDHEMPPEWTFGGEEASAAQRGPVGTGTAHGEMPSAPPADHKPRISDPLHPWAPWHLLALPPLQSLVPGGDKDSGGDTLTAAAAGGENELVSQLRQLAAFPRQTVGRPIEYVRLSGSGVSTRDQSLTFNLDVSGPVRRQAAPAEERRILTYSAHMR